MGAHLFALQINRTFSFSLGPSQEEALCDERELFLFFIKLRVHLSLLCSPQDDRYHPHDYNMLAGQMISLPYPLEFEPTTTGADQAVIIVMSTC